MHNLLHFLPRLIFAHAPNVTPFRVSTGLTAALTRVVDAKSCWPCSQLLCVRGISDVYFWASLIMTFSQSWALYCLVRCARLALVSTTWSAFYLSGTAHYWTLTVVFVVFALDGAEMCVPAFSQLLFYHGAETLLAPIRPLPKFMSIKMIVFLTFYQSMVCYLCLCACVCFDALME